MRPLVAPSEDVRMDDEPLQTADLLHWVEELRAGRSEAATPIFRKIMTRLEVLTLHMFHKYPRVGRFVDVDDVVQNVLIRLLRAMKEVRPESTKHFYALTTELIRRELIDLTRHYYGPLGSGTNLSRVTIGDADGEWTATDPESDGKLDWHSRFHAAVEHLPAEEREVIGLSYYHGWSTTEIAELFQVSDRTIQRRYNAAAERLRTTAPLE